jgi:hypothetical protein
MCSKYRHHSRFSIDHNWEGQVIIWWEREPSVWARTTFVSHFHFWNLNDNLWFIAIANEMRVIPDLIQQIKLSGVASGNNQATYLCDPVSCLSSYCSSKMGYGKSQSSWGRCYHLWYWDMVPTSWVHVAQVYLIAWEWYEYPKLEALSHVPGVANTIQHNTTNEQLENKVEVLIPTPFKKCSLWIPPNPITIAHKIVRMCLQRRPGANLGEKQGSSGKMQGWFSTSVGSMAKVGYLNIL